MMRGERSGLKDRFYLNVPIHSSSDEVRVNCGKNRNIEHHCLKYRIISITILKELLISLQVFKQQNTKLIVNILLQIQIDQMLSLPYSLRISYPFIIVHVIDVHNVREL